MDEVEEVVLVDDVDEVVLVDEVDVLTVVVVVLIEAKQTRN